MSSEVGHQGPVSQEIPMVVANDSFNKGFACCKIILHGRYLEIESVIKLLVPKNAFIEKRVWIIRARTVRLMEVLNSYYVYFFWSNKESILSFFILFFYDALCVLDMPLQEGCFCMNLGMLLGSYHLITF